MARPIKRQWDDAISKIEAEGACRVCGATDYVEAAHVISRKAADVEMTGPRGGRYLYVKPDAVVPLCGPFSANNCHGLYDSRELDLLGYLTIPEELCAVRAAWGIEAARRRLCPSEYKATTKGAA